MNHQDKPAPPPKHPCYEPKPGIQSATIKVLHEIQMRMLAERMGRKGLN